MSIYFEGRVLEDPNYQNEDYLNQQEQFINILKMKTSSLSIKVGEIKLEFQDKSIFANAFIHIDLDNVQSVTVSVPSTDFRYSVHELFRIRSQDPKMEHHELGGGYKCTNLTEFLGWCHDILTVKFRDEWKLVS